MRDVEPDAWKCSFCSELSLTHDAALRHGEQAHPHDNWVPRPLYTEDSIEKFRKKGDDGG